MSVNTSDELHQRVNEHLALVQETVMGDTRA